MTTDSKGQVTDQPVKAGVETVTQTSATQSAPAAPDSAWEQRYKTLLGKYNAEVPRLQAEIGNLKAAIEELKAEREKMAKANRPPLVSEKEREELGNLADVIERVGVVTTEEAKEAAKQAVKPVEESIQKQIRELKHQVFLRELTALEPNWATINQELSWLEWLGQTDSLTGLTRQVLLDKAVADGDAQRAAAFFRQWREEVKNSKPDVSLVQTPALSSLVSPQTSQAASAGTPPKKVFTVEDIKKIELAIARGTVDARRARELRDEILQAVQEGRVLAKPPPSPVAV